nr:uncharacterized protein LOC131746959 [Kogia breviceps]
MQRGLTCKYSQMPSRKCMCAKWAGGTLEPLGGAPPRPSSCPSLPGCNNVGAVLPELLMAQLLRKTEMYACQWCPEELLGLPRVSQDVKGRPPGLRAQKHQNIWKWADAALQVLVSRLSLPPLRCCGAASGLNAVGGKPDNPEWVPPSSSTVSSEKPLVRSLSFRMTPWTCIFRDAAVGYHYRHPAFLLPGKSQRTAPNTKEVFCPQCQYAEVEKPCIRESEEPSVLLKTSTTAD